MAATVTITNRTVQGNRFVNSGHLNLGTYTAGGVAVTSSKFELTQLRDLDVRPGSGYIPEWDATNAKVKVFLQDYDLASADAPLVELGSVDISATEFRFVAQGQ